MFADDGIDAEPKLTINENHAWNTLHIAAVACWLTPWPILLAEPGGVTLRSHVGCDQSSIPAHKAYAVRSGQAQGRQALLPHRRHLRLSLLLVSHVHHCPR